MKNQSGFSLLEMMISVAILSIIALGLSSYMSNLYKQQQAAHENIEIMQLKTFIHSIAIDPESIYTSGDIHTEENVVEIPNNNPKNMPIDYQ